VFWVISVYFNIRNTVPKFGPFLLWHPVYVDGTSEKKLRWDRVVYFETETKYCFLPLHCELMYLRVHHFSSRTTTSCTSYKEGNISEVLAVLGIYATENLRTAKMSRHGTSLPSLKVIFIHWTLPFAQKTLKEHKG